MTKFGSELIQSATEALAIARGEAEPARTFAKETPNVAGIRPPAWPVARSICEEIWASPQLCATGNKGRQPDAPARNLLRVIDYAPETVERALAQGKRPD